MKTLVAIRADGFPRVWLKKCFLREFMSQSIGRSQVSKSWHFFCIDLQKNLSKEVVCANSAAFVDFAFVRVHMAAPQREVILAQLTMA